MSELYKMGSRMTRRHAFVARLVMGMILVAVMSGCQMSIPASVTPTAGDPAANEEAGDTLVIYSGRNENLVGPLLEQFSAETGIEVEVRYGGSAEMAATILEEGANSPADVFFAQDAGALGALAKAARLDTLPDAVLDAVEPRFRSTDGNWVGTSGRARTLIYNTDALTEADLPADIDELTTEPWRGRVGWAPTNGSFQAFVTALRLLEGEEVARQWLEAMIANDVQSYPNNPSIVEATGRGEIAVGLVNHYYLHQFLAEQGESFPARNYYFPDGVGAMINVAGAGVIDSSQHKDAALRFIEFLLSDNAQQFFVNETNEYPLASDNVTVHPLLKPLDEINAPDVDLSDLDDLQGTLDLLQEVGALD